MRFLFAISTILLLSQSFLLPQFANAASETRGLSVIAKDRTTNQSGEVKLYNKSYAVIIGIDEYPKLPADRQLSYAVNDAKGVESALHKHYRFDRIITLYNKEATRDRILELLTDELPAQMGEEDSLFVFWAGHGNQEKYRSGDIGYLIPHDGSPSKFSSNISMTQLKDDISRKIPAKHVFYVMDACYGGLLAETRSVDKQSRRDLSYLKEITKEQVRQVLTAGSKGQEVLDGGPKGHSVFTGRLIEVLEASGDFITANEIQTILKEKVYGDAKGRGHTQTPGYGTFSGSGDFVFIPNIKQKVQDNKAELAKIEAELKKLEVQEAEAKQHQSVKKQREAEQKRKAAEAKLKAEQLRQQQLADEEKRQQEMAQERTRFDAEQQQRESDLSAALRAEEERLAALKAELAKKKQAAPASTGTLEAAVAEIKRLSAEIESIEAAFKRELVAGKERIAGRYDSEIAAVRKAAKQKQAPPPRDEFETEADYKTRLAKHQTSFGERIASLKRRKTEELADLGQRLTREQQSQTAELRRSMEQLAASEYTVGAEVVAVELGTYDPERQLFPVTLRSREQAAPTTQPATGKKKAKSQPVKQQQHPQLVKVAMNGTIPLPKDTARVFKQQWQAGGVRPEVTVRAGSGEVVRVALANDADSYLMEYVSGEFITVDERKLRAERAERAERARREELKRQTEGEMVSVPGGCFQMGDTFGDGDQDEKPVHKVCVSDFAIGKYEVTQGQWRQVMGSNPSNYSSCGDNCPVERVSWNDVQEFIRELNSQTGGNYRLPTEAEWEYACRSGGEEEKYCGGDNENALAWYDINSARKTHPVGRKKSNGLGLYDMSGNVWEWVQDWKGSYTSGRQQDPQGPASGFYRVFRGGSWDNVARVIRASIRYNAGPSNGFSNLGFRLASPSVQ